MHPGHPSDPRHRIVPLFYTGNNFVVLDGRFSNPNFITYIPHHYGVFPMHYWQHLPLPPPPFNAAYNQHYPQQSQPPLLMNPFPQPSHFIHPASSLPPIPPPSRPPSTKSDVSSTVDYVTETDEIDEDVKDKQQDKDSGVERDEERGGLRRNYATDNEDEDDDTSR